MPRDKAPELGVETLYPPIAEQKPRTRIHKSTEHGHLTPVFGSSCPPRGLSGALRDFGYRFSEGRLARWMTLMLADRVDMVEGVLDDFSQGRVPDLPKEMGLKSELKYNAVGFALKVGVAALVIAAVVDHRPAVGEPDSRRRRLIDA